MLLKKILQGLGGKENIEVLDNCITRLRITVYDMSLAQDALIKESEIINLIKLDDHSLQVIIGPQVHIVKNQITEIALSRCYYEF